MGLQFHETVYGRNFFEHQLPQLTRAIEKLAEAKTPKAEQPKTIDNRPLTDECREALIAIMNCPKKAAGQPGSIVCRYLRKPKKKNVRSTKNNSRSWKRLSKNLCVTIQKRCRKGVRSICTLPSRSRLSIQKEVLQNLLLKKSAILFRNFWSLYRPRVKQVKWLRILRVLC